MVEKESHRIRSLREALQLTQEEFAQAASELGIGLSSLYRKLDELSENVSH